MFNNLKAELDFIMERDPAARSRFEVYFLYSGFKAIRSYRKAHWCLEHNMKFLARWISQRSRRKTGIEIHPGATIGKHLFIDHGMGVVIGETTIIGDDCTLFQGVTLGGTGKEHGKRHPTLGNNVLVGAVVLDEIPSNATAVGVPARVTRLNGEKIKNELDHIHYGDPVSQDLCKLEYEFKLLNSKIDKLCDKDKE